MFCSYAHTSCLVIGSQVSYKKTICHSGLDPESKAVELYSYRVLDPESSSG